MKLAEYKRKRHFDRTPEPRGTKRQPDDGWRFVIQKHDATRLHYDFRLELDGVLLSWAVPKGPSLDPADKRLAVHVEDHPIEYGEFEGVIPDGEYGGGPVLLWDRGTWRPLGDPRKDYEAGRLKFELDGEKLGGVWNLVRTRRTGRQDSWLLIKHRDEYARAGGTAIVDEQPLSVESNRTVDEVRQAGGPHWRSRREGGGGHKKATGTGVKGKTVPVRQAPTPAAPRGRKVRQKRATSAKQVASVNAVASKGNAVVVDPSSVTGAMPTAMPTECRPQLATLAAEAPDGDDWLNEIKLDGYRLLAFYKAGKVRLLTRNGLDWTPKFAGIAAALTRLTVDECILDGEAVVLDAQGRSNFQLLQNQLKAGDRASMAMYVFDVIHCNGYNLINTPLNQRKELLRQIISAGGYLPADAVRYTDHLQGDGKAFLEKACEMGLEGIISKRADSVYRSIRSRDWCKTKCNHRQEFVIIGYSDPEGSRTAFGSLLLGYYDNGELKYCGRVGTGFTERSLTELHRKLKAITQPQPPVVGAPREERRAHWVAPKLVAEVEFTEWTGDGRLRHPVFHGLREDKPPQAIVREAPEKKSMSKRKITARPEVAGVGISHPDRVLYPPDVTKLMVAEYYDAVADYLLPHIAHRPLAIVRCPRGQTGKCFFQKNVTESLPDAIEGIALEESDGPATYIAVKDRVGLVSLVQMGMLEMHPWGSRADKLEQPDRVIFDLDPAPDVKWERVKEAAVEVRDRLKRLGLSSVLKTTGGKGLHVVVPLVRRAKWDEVKEFAKAFAERMVRDAPTRYIANMSKSKRTGRIFIDYLRNGRGATAIAAYSTRARPGAPVSTPITWDELNSITGGDAFTVHNIPRRLKKLRKDPWIGFDSVRQSLTADKLRAVQR